MCTDYVVYDANGKCGNYTIAFKDVDFRNRTFRARVRDFTSHISP